MAIYIYNSYPSMKERNKAMKEYRNALEGSIAYDNHEIAVVEDGKTGFVLAIGIDNGHDVHEYVASKGM